MRAQPTRPSDFSAGASPQPQPPQRTGRAWRILAWMLVGVCMLVLGASALVWWWAGTSTSLATALTRAAQYLPAQQTLQARGVSGSLRAGGHIDWLRWSSASLVIDIENIDIGWQTIPLLRRRWELDRLQIARIRITPQQKTGTAATVPLESLVLPIQVDVAFQIDHLQWSGTPAVEASRITGDYHYDGHEHRLNLGSLDLAQGRYNARALLQARGAMALDMAVHGRVRTAAPSGGAPTDLVAEATIKGGLATPQATLRLDAQLRPAIATTDGATRPSAPPLATPQPAMQADVIATLAPWSPQPLRQAQAQLQSINIAALWPGAPTTQLNGTLQAQPPQGSLEINLGWNIEANLTNTLPGPWDQSRLPFTQLQAQAAYDGTRWTVPAATVSLGTGAGAGQITLQGTFEPATRTVQGQARLRHIRPNALHTALAAAPLAGSISVQSEGSTSVRFAADIHAQNTAAPIATTNPSRGGLRPTPLPITALIARGQWQMQAGGGTLQLERLLVDALQARLESTQLRIALGARSAQGQMQLSLPGATAHARGELGPQKGAGELQLQWNDAQRTQHWLNSLPYMPRFLQGFNAQGQARLNAAWQGGWQTLVQQWHAARTGTALPQNKPSFTFSAALDSKQFNLNMPPTAGLPSGATSLQLRALHSELAGSITHATLALSGQARTATHHVELQTRLVGGLVGPGQWQIRIAELRLQAQQPALHAGPWAAGLDESMEVGVRTTPSASDPAGGRAWTIETSSGQAHITGPLPGTVALRWQPQRYTSAPGPTLRLQTQGSLQGLPLAWLDALALETAGPRTAAQPWLSRLGLGSTLVFDGQWNVNAGDTLQASASLRRASGDLRIAAANSATQVTTVQSSGQGVGAGAATAIAASASTSAAGIREAQWTVQADGDTLRTRLVWGSERAGQVEANASTRISLAQGLQGLANWPADAPVAATVHARLPNLGVWSVLAPPGWRVNGTLDANATLSGSRHAPRWSGTLAADDLSVRSAIEGIDFQGGHLRAALQGNQLDITEFRLQGGRSSRARIAGLGGNRTPAPQDGGALTGTGTVAWRRASADQSGIAMNLRVQAHTFQVLARADRQVSVSGQMQAQLQQGQLTVRGQLTTDRATIILPDETAPRLGSDVVVRSAAKDREAQAQAQAAGKANHKAAQSHTAKPPDIAITLNLGNDFALQGQGITTRLAGEVELRSNPAATGAPPRVIGEVHTEEGRYRAWGQMLDIETGLIRFNGPYDNPSLDILALRPHISVRAGVQITGSAQAPRVRLYSEPELPDAEKLSWVVLGRSGAGGGAEAAVLQQAALALLGGKKSSTATASIANRLGLDEIGFKGSGADEDTSSAALTFGKRLSKDLYVTYERSLSGTLGTLYIFYDLTRRLTLRGQTGEKSAVDIIYTVEYD